MLAKGKKAIVLRDGDHLVSVQLTDGNSQILLANSGGRAIRFDESKIRQMGRVSTGVRGMTLDGDDDRVVGMISISPDSSNTILALSEKGMGKRTPLEPYRVTGRGGKGVLTMKRSEKTGELVAFLSVNDDEDLVIINRSGIALRIRIADVPVLSRSTMGVRIIKSLRLALCPPTLRKKPEW